MCKRRFIFQGYFISSVWRGGIYYGPNDVQMIDLFHGSRHFRGATGDRQPTTCSVPHNGFRCTFCGRQRVHWGEHWPIWNLSGNCGRKKQSPYITLPFPSLLLSLGFPQPQTAFLRWASFVWVQLCPLFSPAFFFFFFLPPQESYLASCHSISVSMW